MSKRAKRHKPPIVPLVILVACIVFASTLSRFGGFGAGPSANTDEFARYATEAFRSRILAHQ